MSVQAGPMSDPMSKRRPTHRADIDNAPKSKPMCDYKNTSATIAPKLGHAWNYKETFGADVNSDWADIGYGSAPMSKPMSSLT